MTGWLKRRRQDDGGAGDDTTSAGAAHTPSATAGEEDLRVAGRLHAFNRYEPKYLAPVDQAARLRKERFLGADAFDSVHHAAYKKLYEEFYGSGYAVKALSTLTTQAEAAGASGVTTVAKSLGATVTTRTKSLAKDEVIAG
jgi:hypothetical protein